MTDDLDLWGVRDLPGRLSLELWGEDRVTVELPHVKVVVAALADAAADLAATLGAERAYQAQDARGGAGEGKGGEGAIDRSNPDAPP